MEILHTMCKKYPAILLIVLIFVSHFSFASRPCYVELSEKNTTSYSSLTVGTKVKVQISDTEHFEAKSFEGVYLGKLIDISGEETNHAFFDPTERYVHLIPVKDVAFENGIQSDKNTLIAETVPQRLGSCAAHALINCMHQMKLAGRMGNSKLAKDFGSVDGKINMAVNATMYYYGDDTHRDGIKQMTEEYGFYHKILPTYSIAKFKRALIKELSRAPVLIRFDVGKSMETTDYTVYDHSNKEKRPRRLWQPNDGERSDSQGGHMILISSAFTANNKTYLLVQDANWPSVRLWDAEVLNRLFKAGIRAWSVHDKNIPTN